MPRLVNHFESLRGGTGPRSVRGIQRFRESELAKQVSEAISIPTIGIGAGSDCDGQVLVLHDMLGITTDFSPRFLRRYMNLENQITGAVEQYCSDVRSGDFPNSEESY